MSDGSSRPPATVSTLRAPRPRAVASDAEAPSAIPRAPDVDDRALSRAESQLDLGRGAPSGAPDRRRKPRPPMAALYIRAPRPVAQAFNAFADREGYEVAWHALEALLRAAGEPIEDFDA